MTQRASAHDWPRSQVQSLLFDREAFTATTAKAWARAHGYRHGKVDTTDRYHRLRQFDPDGSPCRTIAFDEGVKAIVCAAAENPVGDRVEAIAGPGRGLRGTIRSETARVAEVELDKGGRRHLERSHLRLRRNPPPLPEDAYDWPWVADLVNEAATQVEYRWAPGTDKVFVVDLFQHLEAEGRASGIDLDEMKRILLMLQRKGLIQMARADLVGAMDPERVRQSEIALGDVASFHFVLDPRGPSYARREWHPRAGSGR